MWTTKKENSTSYKARKKGSVLTDNIRNIVRARVEKELRKRGFDEVDLNDLAKYVFKTTEEERSNPEVEKKTSLIEKAKKIKDSLDFKLWEKEKKNKEREQDELMREPQRLEEEERKKDMERKNLETEEALRDIQMEMVKEYSDEEDINDKVEKKIVEDLEIEKHV